MQRLHLSDDAREAWQSYLLIDPSSEWAAEARRRLNAIQEPDESALWRRDGGRLLELPAAQIERLSLLFPQQARRAAEQDILRAWAEAVLNGSSAKAAAALQRSDVIA